MKLGFVGVGVIAESIITGLCNSTCRIDEIWLSPRNAEVSEGLAARHAIVKVAASNQEVLDRVDVVCLAVRPQIAAAVLADLHFKPDHCIVSFVAAFSIAKLKALISPANSIVRTAPLPAVAERRGTTIVFPADQVVTQIFSCVGTSIELASEEAFDAMFATTSCMAAFFGLLEASSQWLVKNGVPYESARSYLSDLYLGLTKTASVSDNSFIELADRHTTPGGINHQMHERLKAKGVFLSYSQALDQVLERLRGG